MDSIVDIRDAERTLQILNDTVRRGPADIDLYSCSPETIIGAYNAALLHDIRFELQSIHILLENQINRS